MMKGNLFRRFPAIVVVTSFVAGVPSVVHAGDAQTSPAPQQVCVPVVYVCA